MALSLHQQSELLSGVTNEYLQKLLQNPEMMEELELMEAPVLIEVAERNPDTKPQVNTDTITDQKLRGMQGGMQPEMGGMQGGMQPQAMPEEQAPGQFAQGGMIPGYHFGGGIEPHAHGIETHLEDESGEAEAFDDANYDFRDALPPGWGWMGTAADVAGALVGPHIADAYRAQGDVGSRGFTEDYSGRLVFPDDEVTSSGNGITDLEIPSSEYYTDNPERLDPVDTSSAEQEVQELQEIFNEATDDELEFIVNRYKNGGDERPAWALPNWKFGMKLPLETRSLGNETPPTLSRGFSITDELQKAIKQGSNPPLLEALLKKADAHEKWLREETSDEKIARERREGIIGRREEEQGGLRSLQEEDLRTLKDSIFIRGLLEGPGAYATGLDSIRDARKGYSAEQDSLQNLIDTGQLELADATAERGRRSMEEFRLEVEKLGIDQKIGDRQTAMSLLAELEKASMTVSAGQRMTPTAYANILSNTRQFIDSLVGQDSSMTEAIRLELYNFMRTLGPLTEQWGLGVDNNDAELRDMLGMIE